MTYIDELIKDNCPNGVEWKTLGELCKIETGKLNANAAIDGGRFPFFTTAKEISWINTYRWDEEALLIAGNANVGDVKYYSGKFEAYQRTYVLTEFDENIQVKYLYHYIRYDLKRYLELNTKKAAMSYIVLSTLKEFQIPLPPIEIQKEIVKILDKFTEYVTELTAELTLRQKQYSYFRDKLLSFDDESMGGANNKVYTVQWKTLGEVARLKNGRDWKSLPSGEVPVYGSGGEMGEFVSDYAYDKPTVLIPRKGSISNLFYLDKPFWNVDTIYYTEIDDSQMMPRYFYYYLTTVDLERLSTNPTRPSLTQAILDKIEIPLPSLAIQSRIVQALDNFDTVCNDLNIGLPKEIELRQKQYEFFRDKLLTFTAEGVYTDSTVQYRQDLIRLLTWVFGPIMVELGAICDVVRGNGLQKKDFVGSGIPCIHYGQIYTYYGLATDETKSFVSPQLAQKLKKAGYGDVVVATTSENDEDLCKSVVWLGKEQCCISGDSLVLTHEQSGKYLAYAMRTDDFHKQKEKLITGTKVRRVSPANLSRIQLILPPLDQQKHIASILDRFDTLTTDLSQGLPAEIEQRQKQYEYWRDQLLQF